MLRASMARGLRGVTHLADHARSALRIAWLRACYPGLSVGKGVFVGAGTRIRVLNGAILEIGARTVIEPRCLLASDGVLTIGADGFIGTGSTIFATTDIRIGSDALIAANVTIRDQDHRMSDLPVPYRSQGLVSEAVVVGRNVWLGTNAIVLKGVTVGDDAVVAATAVVNRDVPAAAVVAGVPARVVRTRGPFAQRA